MDNFKSYENKILGHNIRVIRETHGVSYEDLSEMVHCSIGHLKNIESGTVGISLELLINISNVLDVCIEDFIADFLLKKRPHLESCIYELISDSSDDELKYYIELIKASRNYLNYLSARDKISDKTSDKTDKKE